MYTVLFFDEANTTEAIGLIKEIMCDKSIAGKPLQLCENLKIIAACNPYRKLVWSFMIMTPPFWLNLLPNLSSNQMHNLMKMIPC